MLPSGNKHPRVFIQVNLMHLKSRRLLTALRIYSDIKYIAIALASSAAFFYLFRYMIAANNRGIFLVLMPISLVYVLVATSGILFSISVFAMSYSISSRKLGAIGGIEGVIAPSIGGLVASCACTFPLLESVLLFLGVNTFDAIGIVSAIASYQIWIISAMILINTAMIYYYLGKMSVLPRKRGKK